VQVSGYMLVCVEWKAGVLRVRKWLDYQEKPVQLLITEGVIGKGYTGNSLIVIDGESTEHRFALNLTLKYAGTFPVHRPSQPASFRVPAQSSLFLPISTFFLGQHLQLALASAPVCPDIELQSPFSNTHFYPLDCTAPGKATLIPELNIVMCSSPDQLHFTYYTCEKYECGITSRVRFAPADLGSFPAAPICAYLFSLKHYVLLTMVNSPIVKRRGSLLVFNSMSRKLAQVAKLGHELKERNLHIVKESDQVAHILSYASLLQRFVVRVDEQEELSVEEGIGPPLLNVMAVSSKVTENGVILYLLTVYYQLLTYRLSSFTCLSSVTLVFTLPTDSLYSLLLADRLVFITVKEIYAYQLPHLSLIDIVPLQKTAFPSSRNNGWMNEDLLVLSQHKKSLVIDFSIKGEPASVSVIPYEHVKLMSAHEGYGEGVKGLFRVKLQREGVRIKATLEAEERQSEVEISASKEGFHPVYVNFSVKRPIEEWPGLIAIIAVVVGLLAGLMYCFWQKLHRSLPLAEEVELQTLT